MVHRRICISNTAVRRPRLCALIPLRWSPLLPPHRGYLGPQGPSGKGPLPAPDLVLGFIPLSCRNVSCSSAPRAGTKLLILFKIRAGRKMCHKIYFAKEKSFLGLAFFKESYFLFLHHHHSILLHPTEIMSHLAEEILIFHRKKKSQTTLSELFWHEADTFQLQHIATTPPALSTPTREQQQEYSCHEDGQQHSQSKLVWFSSKTCHFPAQKKVGLPSCTRTLVHSLLLQKEGRFPLGLGGLFIARDE